MAQGFVLSFFVPVFLHRFSLILFAVNVGEKKVYELQTTSYLIIFLTEVNLFSLTAWLTIHQFILSSHVGLEYVFLCQRTW